LAWLAGQGAGSDGASTQKYAAYGMSKAGMLQLTKSLAEETNGLPVGVHTLSPGLVYTDLVSCGKCAPTARPRCLRRPCRRRFFFGRRQPSLGCEWHRSRLLVP